MRKALAADSWRDWADGRQPLAAPPPLPGLSLACWSATNPRMEQPPLDQHLLAIHLGGPKRVLRAGEGRIALTDVEVGDFSTAGAGQSFRWRTEGPISFAHVFIAPERFSTTLGRIFDREVAPSAMPDILGRRDPLVPQLVRLMFAGAAQAQPLWTEEALERLLARLGQTNLALGPPRGGRHPLALARVARVRDFVRAHLGEPIGLEQLADVAACSPYHFIRSFHAATGLTPYAWVINERVAAAIELLAATDLPLASIARRTGLGAPAQFSARFRAVIGIAPSEYRRRVRDDAGQNPCTSWTMYR